MGSRIARYCLPFNLIMPNTIHTEWHGNDTEGYAKYPGILDLVIYKSNKTFEWIVWLGDRILETGNSMSWESGKRACDYAARDILNKAVMHITKRYEEEV
jgi:hypothetical protein